MNHEELLHDRSSIERGSELINLMQESYSVRESSNEYWDERQNYFNKTIKRLVDSTLSGNVDDEAYTNLGRAVIEARKTQDQYSIEDDIDMDRDNFHEPFDLFVCLGANVDNFLVKHRSKPIAARILTEKSFAIWSNKKFGELNPNFAQGYVGRFEFRNSISVIHLASRFNTKRIPYSVKVLHGLMPQVTLAIGE